MASVDYLVADANDVNLNNLKRLEQIEDVCNSESFIIPNDLKVHIDFEQSDPELEAIINEINRVSTELYILLKDHPQWCNKYLVIHKAAPQIIAWAKEYDYNGIKANGYWTCIKLALKLGNLVLEKYKGVKNPIVDHNLELLLDYALIALDVIGILRKDSEDNPNSDNTKNLITSDPHYFIDLFGLLLSIDEKMVAAMYGRYCGFWLCNQSRYTMMFFVTGLAIGARGLNTDAMQCLYNPEYRGLVLAKLIKSADISFVKMMGSIMEWRVYKNYLPSLLYWNHPLKIGEFHINHQRNWFLSAHNVKVMRFERGAGIYDKKIRCRLYQNTAEPFNDKLIIHMHGGGFIIGSPESHDVYVQNWCSHLPGCSILSVDYSVSPEVKFPVALQQLLDVYLFVSSGDKEVEKHLGYMPKEFILAGDSAGGNLSMSCLLVLNDINMQIKELNKEQTDISKKIQSIVMPKSILNLYSPYNLTLNICPSMILASCDSMISAGVMLSCFEAYLPLIDFNDGVNQIEEENEKNIIGIKKSYSNNMLNENVKENSDWLDFLQANNYYLQMVDVVQSMVENFKAYISPKAKPKPWYLADKTILKSKLEILKGITVNPYISPIMYDNFESLKDVNLYLIALHFDPFLDDNVTMAKKWKGKVQFDVLDGLQHGFLNFMPFVDEAKKANLLCVERLKAAVYC